MWQSPRLNLSSLKPYWQFRSLECFSNWITGLAIRSCFMLIPEAYHSFFEEFESLMYDFPVPILLAKWLHARTSAISWKLRPHQLYPLTSQPAVSTAARSGHPPINRGSRCVMERTELLISEGLCLRVLPIKTYTSGQDSFSEPQVAHLWSVDRITDSSVCGPRLWFTSISTDLTPWSLHSVLQAKLHFLDSFPTRVQVISSIYTQPRKMTIQRAVATQREQIFWQSKWQRPVVLLEKPR